MDLNLITDVKFNKITKSDDGVLTYSFDGINWKTRNERNVNGRIDFSYDSGTTWETKEPYIRVGLNGIEYSFDYLIPEQDRGQITWTNIPQSRPPFFITDTLAIEFSRDYPINCYIDFEFTDPQPIYNIDFDFSVGSCILKYQYSIDGMNYIDFEYFKINVTSESGYRDTIFIKHSSGDKYRYGVYDRNDISVNEYQIIKSLIESNIKTQVFSITEFDVIQYLYSDKNIKHLRIVLSDMDTIAKEFQLLNLDIMSKKVLTSLSDVYDISFIKHHLYRQKYFAEYNFIPSIADTFLKMLSNKEQNV